jgi:hypothetical protein
MFLLLLNIILILVFSVFVLSFLFLRSRSAYVLGLYLISYADIVLILEAAGLFSALAPAVVLTIQILFTAAVVFIWSRKGRPLLFAPFSGLNARGVLNEKAFWAALRNFPLLILLAVGVAYVYLRNAQEVLVLPPRNWDSLTYHLSRVGYWLQYQSFYPWPTAKIWQNIYPMNAELGSLWTILWWGSDQLAGFVQWISVPATMVGIYGLVRVLGHTRFAGAFMALLWCTLPQVIYQSSTTQNDLVNTSFWVAMVYFFFSGVQNKLSSHFYLSGIGFGLAMGTKNTSLIVLPSLLSVLIIVYWLHRREVGFRSLFVKWVLASVAGFTLFGSYIYQQNIVAFGFPLGPRELASYLIGTAEKDTMLDHFNMFRVNIGRYVYQLVDFSPLPFNFAWRVNPIKKIVFSPLFAWFNVSVEDTATMLRPPFFSLDYINPPSEDDSWFGPLMILLIPAILYQGYQGMRRRDVLRIALPLFAVGFLAVMSASRAWAPSDGRYYNTPVALSFPLLACFITSSAGWRQWLNALLVLTGLTIALTITFGRMAWQPISWGQVFFGERRDPLWAGEFNYRMVMESVPQTASIGVASGGNFRDYPFFGEHFTRQVTNKVPTTSAFSLNVDAAPFEEKFQHSDFLYLEQNFAYSNEFASRDFSLLSQYGAKSLWIRNTLRHNDECDNDKWPFKKFLPESSVVVCLQFPLIIGENVHTPTPKGHFSPILEAGVDGGLEFGLLILDKVRVKFSVYIDPGDIDSKQTLQLTIIGLDSRPQIFAATFDDKDILRWVVPLDPDSYRVQWTLVDGSVQAELSKIQIIVP